MTVIFRRKSVKSVADARQKLSATRKELDRYESTLRHVLDAFKHPLTIDFLHRTIANDPQYADRLLALSRQLAGPVKEHIESIVTDARQKYHTPQQEQ